MVKNEILDLSFSETETEDVEEPKQTLSSSRKGRRIILAAIVGTVVLLGILIFAFGPEYKSSQVKGRKSNKEIVRVNLPAVESRALNEITDNLGLPRLSEMTTIEEADWFKSIRDLDVKHAFIRILSKVVQKNSFSGDNKGIIANYCLKNLLMQAQEVGSSFYGDVSSDFEQLLMKIIVENKMYEEIVDLTCEHYEKFMKFMEIHFKVEDYSEFVKVLKLSDVKRADLIEKMKKSSLNFHVKTAIYSHLLVHGFQDELHCDLFFEPVEQWIKIEDGVSDDDSYWNQISWIFYYLVFSIDKNLLKKGKIIDFFDQIISNLHSRVVKIKKGCYLRKNHAIDNILNLHGIIFLIKFPHSKKEPFNNIKIYKDDESCYQLISLLAAFGHQKVLNTIDSGLLTLDLFNGSIEFLKQFSLENITLQVLSLYKLFVKNLGIEQISESSAFKSFLLSNFLVSKMEFSLVDQRLNSVITVDIINQGKSEQLEIHHSVLYQDERIPIEIISKAAFKDANVLINILEKLHGLVPNFKHIFTLHIRFESLLMFVENCQLLELAKKFDLKFNEILSYNPITKKFDYKYLPYELISRLNVENLKEIYKPKEIAKFYKLSELLEYNENSFDNFRIFLILIGRSAMDYVLFEYEYSTFEKCDGRYLRFLNILIYWKNYESFMLLEKLPEDIKVFLRKDFPDLANVL